MHRRPRSGDPLRRANHRRGLLFTPTWPSPTFPCSLLRIRTKFTHTPLSRPLSSVFLPSITLRSVCHHSVMTLSLRCSPSVAALYPLCHHSLCHHILTTSPHPADLPGQAQGLRRPDQPHPGGLRGARVLRRAGRGDDTAGTVHDQGG